MIKVRRILENRKKATEYFISEGFGDWLKPSSKGISTIKSRYHQRLADKYSMKTDKEGSIKFYHHARGHQRYSRLASGKKPFQEG